MADLASFFHRRERLCETPKSPPGDYNRGAVNGANRACGSGVKHLNPRQGITIFSALCTYDRFDHRGVKHLNPRQGITINGRLVYEPGAGRERVCETPKSPPGDYNVEQPQPAPQLGDAVPV